MLRMKNRMRSKQRGKRQERIGSRRPIEEKKHAEEKSTLKGKEELTYILCFFNAAPARGFQQGGTLRYR